MRREKAVTIATLLILAAFSFIYWKGGFSVPEVSLPRRNVAIPARRVGPRSTLLSTSSIRSPVASVRVGASPKPVPSPAVPSTSPGFSPYPADSVCDMMWNISRARGESESDEILFQELDSGGHDDDQSLFRSLVEGKWSEVEGMDRFSDSPSARELSLLGRLGQFMRTDIPEDRAGSVDPVDLGRIDEMASSDPNNAFWPMLKYSILRNQGMSADELESYLQIAEDAQEFRNPVSSFYAEMRRQSFESPQKFVAFTTLYAKAPILDSSSSRTLRTDLGRSPERDARIARIGKLMVDSQLRAATLGGQESHGNLLDAVLGSNLQANAEGRKGTGHATYVAMRGVFYDSFIDLEDWDHYLDPNACDEEGSSKLYSRVLQSARTPRATIQEDETASSNSRSSPSPLPQE